MKSSNDAIKRAEMKQQVKLKFIEDENDEMLCKCLCGLNVTVDDVLTALEYIKESRLGKFLLAQLRLVIDFRKMSKENSNLKCMIARVVKLLFYSTGHSKRWLQPLLLRLSSRAKL